MPVRGEHVDAFVPFETGPLPRPLHRFGGTFPRAIAEAYCEAYTPRRGVVLDPFARPASAADAAEAADRRAVARHVALFGEWARRVLAHAPAEAELVAAFEAVRDRVLGDATLHATLRDRYASTCPTCRAPVVVEAFLWERDAPAPSRKAFRCRVCTGPAAATSVWRGRPARPLLIEPVDDADVARAARADADGRLRAAFAARFGGSAAAQAFAESVVALYTPRNVAALELLLQGIDATLPGGAAPTRRASLTAGSSDDAGAGPARAGGGPSTSELPGRGSRASPRARERPASGASPSGFANPASRAQAFLRLAVLEPVVAGSRLNALSHGGAPLRIEKGLARRGTAAQHREINVWLEFERSFRELVQFVAPPRPNGGIGKRPASGRAAAPLPDLERAIHEQADLVLFEVPSADLLGGWHAVLAALLCGAPEDLVRAEARASARERVLQQVRSALLEARRAIRPGAPAVAYVPHADAGTVAAVALAGTAAGYRLRRILYQRDALAGAARERHAPAAICEFDPMNAALAALPPAQPLRLEDTMRAGVRGAALARGEPIDGDRAVVAALESLAAADLLPAVALTRWAGPGKGSASPRSGLRPSGGPEDRRTGLLLTRGGGVSELEVFFDRFRSAMADAAKSGLRKVTHRGEDAYVLDGAAAQQAPLDDRVEWSVYSLLATLRDAETRALLRRVYALFRGIETPDRELVLRCIASYGVQDEAGRWSLRTADQLAARQEEHVALVADLTHLARRLGLRIWLAPHLQRRDALARLLTEEERHAHLAALVRGPADALAELDCAWYGRGRMVFLWKIDWTARLHHTLVTVGEAIPDAERVFRFLVVADERRDLVRYKFQRSPALAGIAQQRGWRLVKYGPLRAFARQPDVDLNGLEGVLGLEPEVEQAGHQLVFQW